MLGGGSKTAANFYKTPWYHIPGDSIVTDPEISTKI